jgi:hypothetical protein
MKQLMLMYPLVAITSRLFTEFAVLVVVLLVVFLVVEHVTSSMVLDLLWI